MATGFDPYHRWLSIPPSEQPANHYRLLGVAAYEANVEVIQNAAERQSRHVRSHLRSPLGAYAINLIREIEVARLCLTDREARQAYDTCLRQRVGYEAPAPSKLPTYHLFGQPDFVRGQVDFVAADHLSTPAGVVPSIVTNRYSRTKHKSSPIKFLVMWLVSGAIGLLGGYAVLCMIGPQYDFLHVMFRDSQDDIERAEVPAVANETANNRQLSRSVATPASRPQRDANLTVDSNSPNAPDPSGISPVPVGLPPEREIPNAPDLNGKEQLQAGKDLKPVVVPFDLKKRVLRIVSLPDDVTSETLFCNVGGSAELAMTPLNDFPLGEKREVLFHVGMNDTVVGFEISFLRRNDSVVVEIRPKYRLPSGDEEAFYKSAGLKKANRLAKQVSLANNAQRSLPALRLNLSKVTTEYHAVARFAYTPTTAGRSLSQAAAQNRAKSLFAQGADLENQIGEAESLSANLPPLKVDLAAVRQLGEWSAMIAESATLTVSIHNAGVALVAEAR